LLFTNSSSGEFMATKSATTTKNGKKTNNKPVFVIDKRVRQGFGMALFLLALYLSISFLSFVFTGGQDASQMDLNFGEYMSDPKLKAINWSGKIGAYLAHHIINYGFGLGSYFIPYFLFVLSLRMLRLTENKPYKAFIISTFGVIWSSITLQFIFGEITSGAFVYLGGQHGQLINEYLKALIGGVGVFAVLLLSLIIILAIYSPSTLNSAGDNILKGFSKARLKARDAKIIRSQKVEQEHKKQVQPEFTPSDFITEKDDESDDNDLLDLSTPVNKPIVPKDKSLNLIDIDMNDDDELFNENKGFSSDKPTNKHSRSKDTIDFEIEPSNVEEETFPHDDEEDDFNELALQEFGDYDPTLELSKYVMPSIDLLEDRKNNRQVSEDELYSNKNKIVKTLENYGIGIKSIKATIGPTVTLYEIIPADGVRISKIRNLEDDIALSLSALGIRIIAPIPGKGTIGIEVPNRDPEVVSMRSVISSPKFQDSGFELPVAFGKTITNDTYVLDLAKMPHLLVAGATGQGKSVGLNAIITSLLYKKHPSQLKFVLIDPKKVELSIYSKIENHFLAKLPGGEEAIITDVQLVVHTLNSLTMEMEMRYDLLKKAHTRNIKEYNAKFVKRKLNPENGHRFLPYIVVVIDEFADLIMTAGKEVELPIARIAQLARAVGIHMIIATQRPSTNIITGVIKANFPVRVGFKVASMVDSRTILDSPGANQLIGRGDMLISLNSELVRVQCAFIDTPEVEAIVDFISQQQAYPIPFYLPEYVGEDGLGGETEDLSAANRDSLFEEGARIIVSSQSGSTSLLQRRFSIGYNRAGRLMDQLEAAGIVGPADGSKPRKVLISDEYSLEQIFNRLG